VPYAVAAARRADPIAFIPYLSFDGLSSLRT